jgi:endo-1,4-beta-xylanase
MPATRHRFALAAAGVTVALVTAGLAAVVTTAQAAPGCRVTYTVTNQWSTGFGAAVDITNLGDPVSSWNLAWSFGAGQTITQMWNATPVQSGSQVTATSMSYNAAIATNATVSFGFNGAWNGSNPAPTSFSLNGTVCTGGTTTPPTTTTTTATTTTSTSTPPGGGLPSSFRWSSSNVVISPKSDATHNQISIKDPTVVRFNNQWLVYASTVNSNQSYGLVYTSFADFSQAANAPQTYLNTNPNIGNGYRAAPELFFFAPQNKWYLVYQTGPPSFSTANDPTQPNTWTAPRNFFASTPPIVTQNQGSGTWIDFWVICDTVNCYLFFSDDNGHFYRSQTTVANFPNGFGDPVIVMSDPNRFALFEASNVYKVKGQNSYLAVVEAIGSDGKRYFRSWTTNRLDGTWTPLANTEANPFARSNNITFSGTAWTRDISHGEMIRSGNDQTLEIDSCHLQYLYQGMDPSATGPYNLLPWRLGLLTQTNSTC